MLFAGAVSVLWASIGFVMAIVPPGKLQIVALRGFCGRCTGRVTKAPAGDFVILDRTEGGGVQLV